MFVAMATTIGCLVAAGVYLLLRRALVKLLFGVVLLGHAANLMIFTLGGPTRGTAPVVALGESAPPAGHADPVPQALVLTAIVIGFALVAFFAVLVRRVQQVTGTGDVDELDEEGP
jgi:multicomponent Na+:H+ antiporter subunit C